MADILDWEEYMKIISWNCNGKFREKFSAILEEDADIYVIQECENPAESKIKKYKEFAGENYFWTGDIHYKGLGIFAKSNVKIEKIQDLNEEFKNFIALRVNDSFNLLGVWAMPKYVEMIHDYFDANTELFDENLIMCGDFNSNVIWDKEHKTKDKSGNDKNQTNLNIKLENSNLISVYHNLTNEKLGEEIQSTFFMYRHRDKSFFIDYVYSGAGVVKDYEILDVEKWIELSDHIPIAFRINL